MIVPVALLSAAVPTVPSVSAPPPPAIITPAPVISQMPPPALFERATPPHPLQPLPMLLSTMDYPAAAIRLNQQGTVRAALTVSTQGRVTGCAIESSSGSPALDFTTCRVLTARARFVPAKDALGAPVESATRTTIRWVLPQVPAIKLTGWTSKVSLVASGTGQVLRCEEERSVGAPPQVNHCRWPTLLGAAAFTMRRDGVKDGQRTFVSTVTMRPGRAAKSPLPPTGELLFRSLAELTVDGTGKLTGCTMRDVAGSLPPPRQACEQIYRGPYEPGRDAGGKPAAQTGTVEIVILKQPQG